jgi:CheY-like chemotaxis protein
MHDDRTQPLPAVDLQAERLRNRVRSAAFRMTAESERLLDELNRAGHRPWQDSLSHVLVLAKRLATIAAPWHDAGPRAAGSAAPLSEDRRARETQRDMLSALDTLVMMVVVTQGNELVLQDLRAMRDLVAMMFDLPDAQETLKSPDAATLPTDADATERAFRVLVVDDDDGVRDVLQMRLETMGYDVTSAENGRLALEALESSDGVDLVITDIDMPEMDGITLLGMIKGRADLRDIPVLVVSGNQDLSSVTTCIQHGAEDHIAKPYEPTFLRARVVAALERKRLRDIDLDRLRRVARLTAAAESVEHETYEPGSLAALIAGGDAIGQLARTFDRMVMGLRSREARMQERLNQLRHEMGDTSNRAVLSAQRSSDSPFASGQIINERYEIIGELGKGGMGMVYRARDTRLGEEIALKVVKNELLKGEGKLGERFMSEIRLARKISHPNVVRAHDFGEADGTMFITMEYVDGITVAQLLDRQGRLSVESTLAIGTQVCEALTVAHQQHVIHRDIKPANLLLDSDGILKVMDFGIARSVSGDAVAITGAGLMIGTPRYMAPEQLMARDLDARADLFAVGVVLYECLTGQSPFQADSPIGLLAEIMDGDVKPLASLAPNTPARLAALVHQQFKFSPDERSSSAREMAERLAEIELQA